MANMTDSEENKVNEYINLLVDDFPDSGLSLVQSNSMEAKYTFIFDLVLSKLFNKERVYQYESVGDKNKTWATRFICNIASGSYEQVILGNESKDFHRRVRFGQNLFHMTSFLPYHSEQVPGLDELLDDMTEKLHEENVRFFVIDYLDDFNDRLETMLLAFKAFASKNRVKVVLFMDYFVNIFHHYIDKQVMLNETANNRCLVFYKDKYHGGKFVFEYDETMTITDSVYENNSVLLEILEDVRAGRMQFRIQKKN